VKFSKKIKLTSALKSLIDILWLGDSSSSVDGLTPEAISSAANMSTLTSPLSRTQTT